MFLGLGAVYLSRILLRKHPKMTGDELKNIVPNLEGIHKTYLFNSTLTAFWFAVFLFLMYQLNRTFWEERVGILFVSFFAVLALFDGFFALYMKVFPTSTKYNWNSYLYDPDSKFQWVAYWQIGLAVVLLVADFILCILTL